MVIFNTIPRTLCEIAAWELAIKLKYAHVGHGLSYLIFTHLCEVDNTNPILQAKGLKLTKGRDMPKVTRLPA